MIWRPAAQSGRERLGAGFAGEILDLLAGQRGNVQSVGQGAAQLVVTGKTCGFQDGVDQRGIVGRNHAEAVSRLIKDSGSRQGDGDVVGVGGRAAAGQAYVLGDLRLERAGAGRRCIGAWTGEIDVDDGGPGILDPDLGV